MDKLLKFALVGASGTVLNLGLFFLLVDRGSANPSAAAVGCFVVAVTTNYLLNHLWTFRRETEGEKPSARRYFRFVAVSLAGLGVNVGVLNLVLALLHPAYKVLGQAVGIACGMMVNYAGSSLFAFRKRPHGMRRQ